MLFAFAHLVAAASSLPAPPPAVLQHAPTTMCPKTMRQLLHLCRVTGLNAATLGPPHTGPTHRGVQTGVFGACSGFGRGWREDVVTRHRVQGPEGGAAAVAPLRVPICLGGRYDNDGVYSALLTSYRNNRNK